MPDEKVVLHVSVALAAACMDELRETGIEVRVTTPKDPLHDPHSLFNLSALIADMPDVYRHLEHKKPHHRFLQPEIKKFTKG